MKKKTNNDDFGGPVISALPEPRHYAAVNRLPSDTVWEESIQYDRFGRGKTLEHIRATTPGKLVSDVPEAGWINMQGVPCGEFTNGSRPAWIWITE